MEIEKLGAGSGPAGRHPGGPADDVVDRKRAIEAPASARILVEAGPGTGKTEIAARRLATLVASDASPSQVLVLSFSRGAVRTLTKRLATVAGTSENVIEELRHVAVRTFDSWAFRILRLLGGNPADLLRRTHDENIAALTKLIEGAGREAVRQAIGRRTHLIVDEFQDLPGVRGDLVLALLGLLAPPGEEGFGFTVLGDPAQAIYGFAARRPDGPESPSAIEYWKKICSTYQHDLDIVRLTTNHRSSPGIAEKSAVLRAVLLGDKPAEEKLAIVQQAISELPETPELQVDALAGEGSRAILTRTNGEALRVLTRLMGKDVGSPGTPIRMRAASYASLPPAWVGALLRPVRSPSMARSQFDRVYQHLSQLWDEDTRRQLALPAADIAWSRLALASGAPADATSLEISQLRARLAWPDSFPDDQPLADDGLIITTVHQSKGSEFDVVTLLDRQSEVDAEPGGDGKPDEEANVGYVAMTRAARELRRSPATAIYKPPSHRSFRNDRQRLCTWWNGWMNLEIGQKGDIDPSSFVDPSLHGRGQVEALQAFLLENARALEGRKVVLCKRAPEGKVSWLIHLQEEDGQAGRVLGATTDELTRDLLHLLHSKGYSLPWRIFNLRISGVGTMTSSTASGLEPPDSDSRLWLGTSLFGTGDFKPKKAN